MALIHRWPLIANATDVVGGLTATNNGSVSFDATNGASFNGSNQWLSFSKNITSNFSISIWLKFSSWGTAQSPFGASDNGADITGFQFVSTEYAFYDGVIAASGIANGVNSTNYPSTQFILSTITWDGTNLKLYRGNTQVASATGSSATLSNYWSIGRMGAYNGAYYGGKAKDASMYSNALTTTEIATLVSAGPNGGDYRYFPQII